MGSLLFRDGKRVFNGGKAVFTSDPSGCECCGEPPPDVTCGACAHAADDDPAHHSSCPTTDDFTPREISVELSGFSTSYCTQCGASSSRHLSVDDINGTYCVPIRESSTCQWRLDTPVSGTITDHDDSTCTDATEDTVAMTTLRIIIQYSSTDLQPGGWVIPNGCVVLFSESGSESWNLFGGDGGQYETESGRCNQGAGPIANPQSSACTVTSDGSLTITPCCEEEDI